MRAIAGARTSARSEAGSATGAVGGTVAHDPRMAAGDGQAGAGPLIGGCAADDAALHRRANDLLLGRERALRLDLVGDMHCTATDQRATGCACAQFRESHPYRHDATSRFAPFAAR